MPKVASDSPTFHQIFEMLNGKHLLTYTTCSTTTRFLPYGIGQDVVDYFFINIMWPQSRFCNLNALGNIAKIDSSWEFATFARAILFELRISFVYVQSFFNHHEP